MQYLDLSRNHFHGELPTDIGHGLGPNLTMLDISNTIPASLSSLEPDRIVHR
jgi:hypothetical protein